MDDGSSIQELIVNPAGAGSALCCSAQNHNDVTEHTPMVELPPALPPRGAAKIVKGAGAGAGDRPLSGEVRLPTRVRSANKKGVLAQVSVSAAAAMT